MMFLQTELLKRRLIAKAPGGGDRETPAPLPLAYLGDAVFTLYVRRRLLAVEKNKTRVLHDVAASIVSAAAQAGAVEALLPELTPKERDTLRHGRNAKVAAPKSASVRQYRMSTGLECLLGWLYWQDDRERLDFLLDRVFCVSLEKLQKNEVDEHES